MAKPRRRKCKTCREWFHPKYTNEPCCSNPECRKEYRVEQQMKQAKKALSKIRADNKEEEKRQKKAQARKKLETSDRGEMLDKLQTLVNQWVLHVRDKDRPCCTCGKSDPSVKYDAGHYRSRGACSELRFELTNIHKQCSVNCNGWGSGMRKEYREFIANYYGKEHLEWLDGPHPKLKDTLPDNYAIESEIKRYRKLIRDAGLTPNR